MAVEQVDDTRFLDLIFQEEKMIVKYHAAWCGSCRLFAPKFQRLSQEERFAGIKFLDVDTEENLIARKMGEVKNLPSFAIFKDGDLVETLNTNKEEEVIKLIEKLN